MFKLFYNVFRIKWTKSVVEGSDLIETIVQPLNDKKILRVFRVISLQKEFLYVLIGISAEASFDAKAFLYTFLYKLSNELEDTEIESLMRWFPKNEQEAQSQNPEIPSIDFRPDITTNLRSRNVHSFSGAIRRFFFFVPFNQEDLLFCNVSFSEINYVYQKILQAKATNYEDIINFLSEEPPSFVASDILIEALSAIFEYSVKIESKLLLFQNNQKEILTLLQNNREVQKNKPAIDVEVIGELNSQQQKPVEINLTEEKDMGYDLLLLLYKRGKV